MEVVNPYSKDTWVNHPAPLLPASFHSELAAIGGRVPSGEYAGQPILIFEWGQSAMTFRCGKMRLKYVDTNIPAQERPRRCIWRETPELDHLDRETGQPVYKKEVKIVDECPKVLEAGWFYHEDIPELTWIGQQRWYISQWKPADMLGSEEMWEANRYEMWENPETGREERTDMVGPFPRSGRYEPIFAIVQNRTVLLTKTNSFLEDKQELVEKVVMCYAVPTSEHLDEVKKAWRNRDERPFETMMSLSRNAFKHDKDRREEEREQRGEASGYVAKQVEEHLKPKVFQQSVNLENMPTRFGKGRRINVNSSSVS